MTPNHRNIVAAVKDFLNTKTFTPALTFTTKEFSERELEESDELIGQCKMGNRVHVPAGRGQWLVKCGVDIEVWQPIRGESEAIRDGLHETLIDLGEQVEQAIFDADINDTTFAHASLVNESPIEVNPFVIAAFKEFSSFQFILPLQFQYVRMAELT